MLTRRRQHFGTGLSVAGCQPAGTRPSTGQGGSRQNLRVDVLPLLLLGCVAGMGLSAYSSLRARLSGKRQQAALSPVTGERVPWALESGDVLQRGESDWLVQTALRLSGAGPWRSLGMCQPVANEAPRLILCSMPQDDEWPVWLLSETALRRPDLIPAPQSPPTLVLAEGELQYRLIGGYEASVRGGELSHSSGQSLSLWCYRGPGSQRLLCARWSAETSARVYVGEAVSVADLTFYPHQEPTREGESSTS